MCLLDYSVLDGHEETQDMEFATFVTILLNKCSSLESLTLTNLLLCENVPKFKGQNLTWLFSNSV